MVNKSKQIGTGAETGVRNYLLERGFTKHEAHREVLAGSADQGDVWLRHPTRGLIVFEVKAGAAAKTASYEQCERWYEEAELERDHADGQLAILVTVRSGFSDKRAGNWYAFVGFKALLGLTGPQSGAYDADEDFIVRLPLSRLIDLIGA